EAADRMRNGSAVFGRGVVAEETTVAKFSRARNSDRNVTPVNVQVLYLPLRRRPRNACERTDLDLCGGTAQRLVTYVHSQRYVTVCLFRRPDRTFGRVDHGLMTPSAVNRHDSGLCRPGRPCTPRSRSSEPVSGLPGKPRDGTKNGLPPKPGSTVRMPTASNA